MLRSARVREAKGILESLRSNPYLQGNEAATVAELLGGRGSAGASEITADMAREKVAASPEPSREPAPTAIDEEEEVPEEAVSAYLAEHAAEVVAEEGKPFQPIGGIMDLLGADYFPISAMQDIASQAEKVSAPLSTAAASKAGLPEAAATAARTVPQSSVPAKRDNAMQKINRLDVKGRIQLALKGNKEERSLLIRDGTKVVALAVLEAPKLSDGEVEKFALQKNVLEAVLRQIPLKRRFMKNYIVVRNLVANPRTPLDLGLGLMKHLMTQDLKNISNNKEISETVRKLAMKMYKQKLDAANKK
jgi:hypothetical protein